MWARSTLARWLTSAGYGVELAESERRAWEILAHSGIALVTLAGGIPVFDHENSTMRILVIESSQAVPAGGADGWLSLPLDERAALTGVEEALQAQSSFSVGYAREEMLFFDAFTVAWAATHHGIATAARAADPV